MRRGVLEREHPFLYLWVGVMGFVACVLLFLGGLAMIFGFPLMLAAEVSPWTLLFTIPVGFGVGSLMWTVLAKLVDEW